MKHICLLIVNILLISVVVSAQNYTAKEIIKLADDKNRGLSSKGEKTVTNVQPASNLAVARKTWRDGDSIEMVLRPAPPKEI